MTSLVLFLTHGSSLRTWKDAGILDRELAIYEEHARNGVQVDIISHGAAEDKTIAEDYPFLSVHSNTFGLHPRLYTTTLPVLHKRILQAADIYKTNQAYGAHLACRCARLWGKPWILRQGYGHYENREKEFGEGSGGALRALRYERRFMRQANANIVTSSGLAERSVRRHGLEENNIHIVPNYVVTKNWQPGFDAGKHTSRRTFAFVGRLSSEKNLMALIEAFEGLPADLSLVGVGPQQDALKALARRLKVNCTFHGRLSQADVRDVLAQADVFVLPSLYEGHPKALIEAMTFGIPVLGSNTEGIRDIIRDGETGLLAPTDAAGLSTGIKRYLEMDGTTYVGLSANAQNWATEKFSLQQVAARERLVFNEVIARG